MLINESRTPLPASQKRIRLELQDESGDKVTVVFEGRLSRKKFLQLADLAELYGGDFEENARLSKNETKVSRLEEVIQKYFPFGYFNSKDALEAFENEYREPIPLATVSTYLSRLANRGFLQRVGMYGSIKYRVNRRPLPSAGEQTVIRSRV